MNTQYCTFQLGSLLLGVEARMVQEVLRAQTVTPVPLAPPFVRGLMNLRGQIVLVLDLERRLGTVASAGVAKPINVLVNTSAGLVSLEADRIGDVLSLDSSVVDPVPDTLESPARDVLAGAIRLADQILLLLAPERVALHEAQI